MEVWLEHLVLRRTEFAEHVDQSSTLYCRGWVNQISMLPTPKLRVNLEAVPCIGVQSMKSQVSARVVLSSETANPKTGIDRNDTSPSKFVHNSTRLCS